MPSSILERIANGDRTAVAECIDEYSGLIWSLSRRFLGNESDAEEVVQEIFVELWQKASRFDPEVAAEVTFVSMLARRRLIDRRRSIDNQPPSESFDERESCLTDDAQRVIEASVEVRNVIDVISTLKPEQQEVINMASWLGMSHGAIATQTGLPLGTVKSHLSRGLSRIRKVLGEPGLAIKVTR